MMASGGVRLRAAPGGGIPGLHGAGPMATAMGMPLDARAVASFVSPLRLHAPLYDRLHGLPGLPPLDPALLSAAHQVTN